MSADADRAVEVEDAAATDAALDVLADAIDYYHDQLDRVLPAAVDPEERTVRAYIRDDRGWTDETINAARLGYAPADSGAGLLDYLMARNHDRDAILGSGLFYEGLTAHFRGRVVFPYADAAGERPVYAISRSLGQPDDSMADQKYTKAVNQKPYSRVEEPIYGVSTIRDDAPLLITEGIADAIAAHQAGYSCVSPVTKTFKLDDREELRHLLADHGVERVYIVQDAEPPGSSFPDDGEGIHDLLLPQVGEGLDGALNTAAFLADAEDVTADVRVAELPMPAAEKVDLDDYLNEWSRDNDADPLAPVLAGAKPAAQHPAFDPEERVERAVRAATQSMGDARASGGRSSASDDRGTTGDARSALYDLSVLDVTPPGVDATYRGPNPLGHHGDSENYATIRASGEVLADYKHPAAYNALTYLLVEAGERRAESPFGSLTDRETFVAWRTAKEQGALPDDDPIPTRALIHVALDAGLCEADDVVDGWRLPREAYNDALATVRDEHGLDPGRDTLSGGGGGDADPVAVLPLAQIDALTRRDPEQAKRYARKRGVTWPTTEEVREELFEQVREALANGESVTIDAPTSSGKSFIIATTPWLDGEYAVVTGGEAVVHLHATRDARDDAIADSEAAGVEYAVIRNRKEVCPVCAGEHDPAPDDEEDPDVVLTMDGVPALEWIDQMCGSDDHPGKGMAASVAHARVAEYNDQGIDLPCEAGDRECRLQTQWEDLETDDGDPAVDVIHATHPFAHVPSLRCNANVVFDEQPDFGVDLSTDRLQRAVGAFLREVNAPTQSWEGFVSLACHDGYEGDAARERDATKTAINRDPRREWYFRDKHAHTLAPALARATWYALRDDPDENGRLRGTAAHEPPRLDANANSDVGWNREWVTVVLDADGPTGRVEVETVRAAPDLSQARSVVGLDAHPVMHLWQRNARPDMTRRVVLDPDDRACWRRFERGLTVVQLGDATRPAGGNGQYIRYDGDDGADPLRVVIAYLREHYGEDFRTGITASKAEEYFEEAMRECGISDPETMHYGEEKSRNDFADELVGLVNGCIDPGDDYVVNFLAECGLDARPETEPCETCGGDGGGSAEPDCMDGQRRAKGRGFIGPDADAAADLLASVRENHVAQAAGRYARNPDDPDSRAVVFVRTDATPPGFVDYHAPDVAWAFTDTQRTIIETVADAGGSGTTAKAVAEATGVSKKHVRTTLNRLAEKGHATVTEGGYNGANVFRAADAPSHGVVDLNELPVSTATTPVRESYTWVVAVHAANVAGRDAARPNGGESAGAEDSATADGGGEDDPPPT